MIEPFRADDAFLADVASVSDSSHTHLWWLGQSGFLTRSRGKHLLIDPYLSDSLTAKYANTDKPHVRMSSRVIDPARLDFIDVVTSSHNHTDHLDAQTIVPLFDANPDLELIIPEANRRFVAERLRIDPGLPIGLNDAVGIQMHGHRIFGVPAAHPELERDENGLCRFLGLVFRSQACTIYHSGDTVYHDDIIDRLKEVPEGIDVAILPINGKVGNMNGVDAARLAKAINAKLVIPCHYDMFEFNTADPYAEFVPECERIGQRYRVLKLGEGWSSEELAD